MLNKELKGVKKKVTNATKKLNAQATEAKYKSELKEQIYELGAFMVENEVEPVMSEDFDKEAYEAIITKIQDTKEKIDAVQKEVNKLNGKTKCEVCGTYSDKDANFCPHCGVAKPAVVEEEECECTEGCECNEGCCVEITDDNAVADTEVAEDAVPVDE